MAWLDDDYPPVRYHEEEGEVSALFRPAGTPADLVAPSGARTGYLATKASTGGEFGLYRVRMGPEAAGTSTHFHRTISESFYVVAGTLRVYDGDRWSNASAGDFLYMPPRGLHSFGNESGEPVEFLMLFSPGAAREGYFEGVGDLAGMSDEERAAFFVHHDSYFTDMAKGPSARSWRAPTAQ
ncbi:cupin domain-containing protein [Actinomadura sp. LD22]|uniref:Cupin domain-containing protein n=1 Tax=Actinomadura physcomitrii TaxID=2650748 RepID=A0A6I4M8C1_9ACTN|nr:cupin domain-containing protein [Actinomadura physcomitrii]MWA00337.1 cupin domain-containing protein [Actinomadura physcomitrii]